MATEALEKLIDESSYVFKATVTQLSASNEPAIRPGPGLVVARVDEAFQASPSIGVGGLLGREVTMRLAGGPPALGDELIVFANEWMYGTQIALREVAHQKATPQAQKAAAEAVERLPIRRLKARLEGAVRVVDGEVERIGPSPVPDGFTLRSPNYQLAMVRVESTLKGKGEEHVNVLFPTNPAPPWRTAPRLKQHEKAIFILRHETVLRAPSDFLTAPEPGDVRSRDMLPKIKSLLKSEGAA